MATNTLHWKQGWLQAGKQPYMGKPTILRDLGTIEQDGWIRCVKMVDRAERNVGQRMSIVRMQGRSSMKAEKNLPIAEKWKRRRTKDKEQEALRSAEPLAGVADPDNKLSGLPNF